MGFLVAQPSMAFKRSVRSASPAPFKPLMALATRQDGDMKWGYEVGDVLVFSTRLKKII